MKVKVPDYLISRSGSPCFSVPDSKGNEISFAFSSAGKAKKFCVRNNKYVRSGVLTWYNKDVLHDLCVELDSDVPPEKMLVAIDACGLRDASYQVVRLADLIKAIEDGKTEIECSVYETHNENRDEQGDVTDFGKLDEG